MRLYTVKLPVCCTAKAYQRIPVKHHSQAEMQSHGPACVCVAGGLADVSAALSRVALGLGVSTCGDG